MKINIQITADLPVQQRILSEAIGKQTKEKPLLKKKKKSKKDNLLW